MGDSERGRVRHHNRHRVERRGGGEAAKVDERKGEEFLVQEGLQQE